MAGVLSLFLFLYFLSPFSVSFVYLSDDFLLQSRNIIVFSSFMKSKTDPETDLTLRSF